MTFLAFVIILAVLCFLCTVYVKEKQNKVSSRSIEKYKTMLSPIGIDTVNHHELSNLDERARTKVFSLLTKHHLSEKEVYYTNSSLGVCAFKNNCLIVSLAASAVKPRHTVDMELFGFFKTYNPAIYQKAMRVLFDKALVNDPNSGISDVDYEPILNEYTVHLKKMVEIIQEPIKITSGRIIKVKDIAYYKVEGTTQFVSDIKGGGANVAGAVYGSIIAGGAGAVVGSKMGTEIKTDIVRKDDRKLFLYYMVDGELKSEEIITDNIDCILSLLREWMPDKEYSYVVANNNIKSPMNESKALPQNDTPRIEAQTTPVKRSYAELKELKELLDLGIITQAEFDQKKREILG